MNALARVLAVAVAALSVAACSAPAAQAHHVDLTNISCVVDPALADRMGSIMDAADAWTQATDGQFRCTFSVGVNDSTKDQGRIDGTIFWRIASASDLVEAGHLASTSWTHGTVAAVTYLPVDDLGQYEAPVLAP